MTDDTRQETGTKTRSPLLDENGRFKKGNPGGPGRPKGSRDALAYDFVEALQREFLKRGRDAISDLDSATLCTMITKVMPKESVVDLNGNFSDLLMQAADVLAKRGK